MWSLPRAVAAALLFGGVPAQVPGVDFVLRTGPHFRVELHPGKVTPELATRLADEALAAAESVWPVFEKQVQLRGCKPATIHVYCSAAEFRAVEKAQHPAKFLVEAFAAAGGQQAHALLWPQLSARALRQVGLPQTTAQNVMLLASKLVFAQQLTPDQSDPFLLDVLALGVLEAVTNPARTYGVDVPYDTRRYWVHGQDGLPPPELVDLVAADSELADRDLHDSREGHRAVAAQHLALDDAAWMRKLLGKARTRKAAVPIAAHRRAVVESLLGADWARTQQKFDKLCRDLHPLWQESAPLFCKQGRRWLLVGDEARHAAIYAIDPPPAGDFAIRAAVELERAESDGGFRFQLDWNGTDMLGVWLEPDVVTLSSWTAATGKWQELRGARVQIAAGRPFDVAIEVRQAQVRVLVDGTEALAWDCSGRGMHGAWSLAAGDTVTWLEGLKIEPLPGPKK